MPGCGFTNPITSTCADFNKQGGANKRFWIGNFDDLDRTQGNGGYSVDVNGNVTGLYFKAYTGLYRFETKKNTSFGGVELVKGEGAPNSFTLSFATKIFKETAAAYQTLEDLSGSDVFVIEETNAGLVKVFGLRTGMEMATLTQSDGINPATDSSISITFTGGDSGMPLFFLVTDLPRTIEKVETYEV